MTEKNENKDKKKEKDEWVSSILIAIIAAIIIRVFIFAPTIVKGPSMQPTLHENNRLIAERLSYFLNIKPNKGDVVTFTEPNSSFYVESNPVKKLFYFFTKREYIKRVIGVEGDHVELKGDNIIAVNQITGQTMTSTNYEIKKDVVFIDGEPLKGEYSVAIENASVYINGKKLEEDYTNGPWGVKLSIENGKIGYGKNRFGEFENVDINVDITVPKGYIFVMGDNRNYSSDSRKFTRIKNDYTTVDGCIRLKELSGRIMFRFWPFDALGGLKK